MSETALPITSPWGPDYLAGGHTAAAWTGEFLYILGHGENGTAITRWDPETDDATRLDAELPGPRFGGAAIWTGEAVFVVGGVEGSEVQGDIVYDVGAEGIARLDPAEESVRHLDVELPFDPVHAREAPFVGGDGAIYLPGRSAAGSEGVVHWWRPGMSGFEELDAQLPSGFGTNDAVWVEDRIVTRDHRDNVHVFNISTGETMVHEDALPWASHELSESHLVADGSSVVALPGSRRGQPVSGAPNGIRLDPATGSLAALPSSYPPFYAAETFAHGGSLYVLVGHSHILEDDGHVLRWDPDAAWGSSPGEAPFVNMTLRGSLNQGPPRVSLEISDVHDPDGFIVEWNVTWGDGNRSHGLIRSHAYASEGVYNVTLTVTDDDRNRASATETIDLVDRPPTVDAMLMSQRFRVEGNDLGSFDAYGYIETYQWTWGDGNASLGKRAKHQYNEAGCYIVRLTVTDDDGQEAMRAWRINASPRPSTETKTVPPLDEDAVPEACPAARSAGPKENASNVSDGPSARPTPWGAFPILIGVLAGLALLRMEDT